MGNGGAGLKLSRVMVPAAVVALLMPLAFAGRMATQAPGSPKAEGGTAPHGFPAPTNLKVLPKEMNGQQVHDLMEQWKAGLGVDCDSCHAADPGKMTPDGRPLLNFADDSKPMKKAARIMYGMTEEINVKYVSQVDGLGVAVTCGTCHRGHMSPDPFVIPPEAGQSAPEVPPPSREQPEPQ